MVIGNYAADLRADFYPLITFSHFSELIWSIKVSIHHSSSLLPEHFPVHLSHPNSIMWFVGKKYLHQAQHIRSSAARLPITSPLSSRTTAYSLGCQLCGTLRTFRAYRDVSKCFATLVTPLFISSCNSLWRASHTVHLYINICMCDAFSRDLSVSEGETSQAPPDKYTIRTSFTNCVMDETLSLSLLLLCHFESAAAPLHVP